MPAHAADEILLGFTRALRAAGLPITLDRSQTFLAAVAALGTTDPAQVRRAGHATLCAGPEDLARFDQVFDAWFNHREPLPTTTQQPVAPTASIQPLDGGGAGEDSDSEAIRAMASDTEVLRHRDVADLDAAERHRLNSLMAVLRPRAPQRRTARHRRWHRGELDARRTLRSTLQRLGEPGKIAHRRRSSKPRRVVILLDVSGSMAGYAEAHLRLAHRVVTASGRAPVEVFTIGTRLTRITRAFGLRDPERALTAAGETVPDWSGGTRLGESLRVFLDRFGARGMARGAVVVLVSDGWERGDTTLLSEQMARLARLAHRVVWVNPHRGKVGYEPVQQGMVAALPHVDDFLAGHSLATFAELMEVVGDA